MRAVHRVWSQPSGSPACEARLAVPGVWAGDRQAGRLLPETRRGSPTAGSRGLWRCASACLPTGAAVLDLFSHCGCDLTRKSFGTVHS